MSFDVFENELPDIFIIAEHVEQLVEIDYVLALHQLQEIGRLLVHKILVHENVEMDDSDPFIHLAALMEIEILPLHMETALKQLAYCGTGVYRWSDGAKYEGQWLNDSEHGSGVKTYANGDCYRGEWKDGLFHGNGSYTWLDGAMFEGGWQDNLEHGYGTKVYQDGYVQQGFWTRGELVFTKDQLGQSKPVLK